MPNKVLTPPLPVTTVCNEERTNNEQPPTNRPTGHIDGGGRRGPPPPPPILPPLLSSPFSCPCPTPPPPPSLLLPLLLLIPLPLPVAMSAGALQGIVWEDRVTPLPHPSNKSNRVRMIFHGKIQIGTKSMPNSPPPRHLCLQ